MIKLICINISVFGTSDGQIVNINNNDLHEMMKGYVSESSEALLLKGAFLYWRIDNRARIKTLAKNVKTAENPPEPTDTVENSSHKKMNKKERMLKRFNRVCCYFFCRMIKNYRMRWFFKVFKY